MSQDLAASISRFVDAASFVDAGSATQCSMAAELIVLARAGLEISIIVVRAAVSSRHQIQFSSHALWHFVRIEELLDWILPVRATLWIVYALNECNGWAGHQSEAHQATIRLTVA